MASEPQDRGEIKVTRWVIAAVLLVSLVGVGGWLATRPSRDAPDQPAGATATRPAQPGRAVQAERESIRAWVFAQGTARSIRREYLTFERSGRVIYVKPGPGGRDLRPGDQISEGEVLARLDRRQLQSEIDSAEAALAEAKA